jgi:hypothetical protein
MAVLSEADRVIVLARFMGSLNELLGPISITKVDLRAGIDATDAWIDANASAFNTALPTAARTNLTLSQKVYMFCCVALRRAGL